MPIEIRELVIRATVEESTPDTNSQPATPRNQGNRNKNEVTEKILEILKDKNER